MLVRCFQQVSSLETVVNEMHDLYCLDLRKTETFDLVHSIFIKFLICQTIYALS